jgi:predicted ATPase
LWWRSAQQYLGNIEQPEIHLHPKAQVAMASVLANAARRGVRVVAETHSSLLLLGIQSLVASGKLSPDLVKLHWFKRNGAGQTEVCSADMDETGSFGEWPEDFGQTELMAEKQYLDAVAARHMKGKNGSEKTPAARN